MIKRIFLIAFVGIMLIFSCNKKAPVQDIENSRIVLNEEVQEVSICIAKKEPFVSQIISNGKLFTSKYADMYWQSLGIIEKINVKNGQIVKEGDVIAELNDFKSRKALESAAANLEQSKLQMYEILIEQGYSIESINQVPEKILDLAKIKSGYENAKSMYDLASWEVMNTKLIAPFHGVIANVSQRGVGLSDLTKPFCKIIDYERMNVEFFVMEHELVSIKEGDEVEVKMFNGNSKIYSGKISEINPFVDENSKVKVIAQINNSKDLYDGMNVRVSINKKSEKVILIPREAVVIRSGKPVVFVAKKSKAQWHSVTISGENNVDVAISEGITEGDSVIVTGNINLAHNSNIVIR